jgi:ureidoacrylate peracid hydrolase
MSPAAGPALLLLVDLQRSFCDSDGSMAKQNRNIDGCIRSATRCNALARDARDHGVQVVWTRMVLRPDYADGGELTRTIRPNLARIGALRAGSGDEELSRLVHDDAGDIVIDKPRYSALYATSLEVILRSGGYRTVLVAGVTTSMCVESTVRDLGQRDYQTFVIEDACADFDDERHRASIASMAFGFARVVTSDEATAVFQGHHHD